MANEAHAQPDQDKILKDSFPASDAPANSGVTGAEPPDKPSHERDIEERPPERRTPTGTRLRPHISGSMRKSDPVAG